MQRVLRIGHRGAAGHAPENTLASIQKGIALGVDFVEIDRKVIEQVKTRERTRMKDYVAHLEANNLRFAPPIQ